MPKRLAPLDFSTPAIEDKVFTFTARWRELLRLVIGDVESISSLPAVINRGTYTELNALGLGAGDAGYLAFETVTGHLLRWTGTAWEFAPGDVGNGFRRDYAITPQETGWVLMDGTATSYLTLGAALSLTAHTPPNLTGSPAFHKSIAAYTGTIEAAVAPALSGSTGSTAPGMTGSTATESAHTHGSGTYGTGTVSNPALHLQAVDTGTAVEVANKLHEHVVGGTSSAGSAHGHGLGTLAVDSHLHAAGTLAVDSASRPPSIGWLAYFRR